MTPILKVTQIEKSFGYRKLLKGVDLDLQAGEFALLLGKNGQGKSTLLKIITGLMRAEAGLVEFEGKKVADHPEEFRAAFGVISHAPQLYSELTAIENLEFYARLRKLTNYRDKIRPILKSVGLEPFAHTKVGVFSSGMFKRLNIARLMIFEPRLLLLDEPYTGLDYDSIEFFNDYLEDYKEKGGTVLMVTHQIDLCYPLSDRIFIINQGKSSEVDKHDDHTLDDLLNHYQTLSA